MQEEETKISSASTVSYGERHKFLLRKLNLTTPTFVRRGRQCSSGCILGAEGYSVFDDPLQVSCLGALEALKDMIEHFRVEQQAYPCLVYRAPKLEIS